MSITSGPWRADEKPRQRTVQPFEPFSPAKWQGAEPPPYDWMVDGCFLRGTVAMLSGDGGLGKSLLMQQLCTAAAVGKPWLGLETRACKTFAFFCEDDEDELHRRQVNINRLYDCDSADLEDVLYISRVGMENVLMEFNRQNDAPKQTPLFDQLRHSVIDFGAQIVVLDTLADTFAGNEIIRNQVRRFISALRKLAVEIQGTVILTAHPSNAGLSSGTGISGSTAWNNSVRSRLYLTRKNDPTEDGGEDNSERLLKTMKNNQGPFGGKIGIKWDRGVFVRLDGSGVRMNVVDVIDLDNKLLAALGDLIENGVRVPADWNNRYGFANVMRTIAEFKHLRQAEVIQAQSRMLKQNRITKVSFGPKSKRVDYLRPASARYPGEDEGETE